MSQTAVAKANPAQALEAEIASTCAHIDSALGRLMRLLADYDDLEAWDADFGSVAGWLSWRCGLSPHAAREAVRVARCLKDLPKIADALTSGQVSYAKARALSRVATKATEEVLLDWAKNASAAQIERLCCSYRGVKNLQLAEANEHHARRYLSYFFDDSGDWVIRGRLAAEDGAVVDKALNRATDALVAASSDLEKAPNQCVEAPTLPTATRRRLGGGRRGFVVS